MTPSRVHMHEKLRQPDFARHRNAKSLSLLLNQGQIDICRPFAPWELPDAPTWLEDPYKDDTWGLYYHALGWLIILDYGIDNATDQATRDSCAEKQRSLLRSYLTYLVSTPEADVHKMVWFDHSTAWRASTIAYLYERRFKGTATPEETELFHAAARLHEAKLTGFIESGRWKANNHGIFHAEALWDMACAFEAVLDSDRIRTFALNAMRSVFAEMIDFEEGVCREQSIYYHLFDASLLVDSARYMGGFGIEVVPGYRDILKKMLDFYHDFHQDDDFLQPIGDSQFGKLADTRLLQNIHTAISYERSAGNGTHSPEPVLLSYPRNGYYFFRETGIDRAIYRSATFIDKCYHGAHGHSDGGSFTMSCGGEPFLVDSGGPYAYGKRLRFDYFKAAEGHNVAIFGKTSKNYLTRATATSQGPLGHCVRIETIDLEGAAWQRTVVALRGGVYVLVDKVSQDKAGPVDFLFHFAPSINVTRLSDSRLRLTGESSAIDMQQASSAAFELIQNAGESGFPRGLVTRDLGKFEPAPVLSTCFRTKNTWLVTMLGLPADISALVHSLHGGKMIRIMIPGEQSIGVDCRIDDASIPARIYSFRAH